MGILTKIFGDPNERIIKNLQPIVDEINALEDEFTKLSDEELRAKTTEFKKRITNREANGFSLQESLDLILPEAFASVREAAKRTLGQRHFDVQLIGGITLHRGQIAEMKTGEGKTLVATLPAYLNALAGKGVHLVTVNDYLARRDAVWMGQIYHLLGLHVGVINHDSSFLYDPSHTENPKSEIRNPKQIRNSKSQTVSDLDIRASDLDQQRDQIGSFKVVHEFLRPCSRKDAYAADITYGTNNEFGFDYLRDNMIYRREDISQQNHYFAIVDEVDSILIDEARTPLIISAPAEESGELYKTFSRIVPNLKENIDYNVDEKLKAATITEAGIEKIERILGIPDIYTEKGLRYVHHLEQALRAQALFVRDRDYVVKSGEVIIVDEFTGRLMPGRRWSEGLHQAVEAKEGVSVQKESRTFATITFQNYFRLYTKLAGMTGTAATSAEEFHKVYKLEVVQIPTNRLLVRKDLPDRIYQTAHAKWRAVALEIQERHKRGQPVLVGTVSIEKNEMLSALLSREGVPHRVLNAKNHEEEGAIIAQAGRLGAITVATNMAGRGVDIILGGNPKDLEQSRKVLEVGGLLVIGTERHEARRIDDQLRGRAGRQGDPGASQFYSSLEDDLMRIFGPGPERIKNLMARLGVPEDEPIENKMVSRSIESAQGKIEGFNFDMRKHVLEYDDVMNKQRSAIYSRRRRIVFATSSELNDEIKSVFDRAVNMLLAAHARSDYSSEWNREEIEENMRSIVGDMGGQDIHQIISATEDSATLRDSLIHFLEGAFLQKKASVENYLEAARVVMLQAIDMLWVEHLEAMDYMRNSVRLRAYGQRDPLVEYKNEGARMFQALEGYINSYITSALFKIAAAPPPPISFGQDLRYNDPSTTLGAGSAATPPAFGKNIASNKIAVGRNDPCPCGSGKKYKRCHLNSNS